MNAKTEDIVSLFTYFLLFDIDRFALLEVNEKLIRARVGWANVDNLKYYDPEEEQQEIVWEIQDLPRMQEAMSLAQFIRDRGLICTDKIQISQNELYEEVHRAMGWPRDVFDTALSSLLAVNVDMIDDGKKTDYYFLHF